MSAPAVGTLPQPQRAPPVMPTSAPVDFETSSTHDPDVLTLLMAYYAELQACGLDDITLPTREALAAETDVLVILSRDSEGPLACAAMRRFDDHAAEIKRMFVAPRGRGRGLAVAMLRSLEQRAAQMGYNRIVLDTAAVLPGAIKLYRRTGYQDIPRYNDNPHAAFWFEKTLSAPGA